MADVWKVEKEEDIAVLTIDKPPLNLVHIDDLILMGGYGYGPVAEVVLGSAVDGVLRASSQPVLICR